MDHTTSTGFKVDPKALTDKSITVHGQKHERIADALTQSRRMMPTFSVEVGRPPLVLGEFQRRIQF